MEHTMMLETRLCVPQLRQGALLRPGLLDKLQAAPGRKLTLLVAPAGFGKTTTVLQWLEQQEAPVAWLSLEESDTSLPLFLLYLIAALQKLEPSFGAQTAFLLESTQERQPALLLTPLLNDFLRFAKPLFVVLDDIHHLKQPALSQALSFLLQHLPPHVHLVMTSREMPLFSLARLRARGELLLLYTHDLRFSTSQAKAFFHDTMGLDITQEQLEDLVQRTEGWITGLQLAGLSLQYRAAAQDQHSALWGQPKDTSATKSPLDESSQSALQATDPYIDDFLMTEVFAQLPTELQHFLLRSSVLNQLSAARCDWLLEREDSASLLERLTQRQLFLHRVATHKEGGSYRYHGLFQEWLQHRLELESPGEAATLHQRAALWCQEHGHLAQSVQHWLAARRFTQVAGFLEEHAETFFKAQAFALFGQWLEALPEALLHKHPQLIAYRVLTLFLQRTEGLDPAKLKLALRQLQRTQESHSQTQPEQAQPEQTPTSQTQAKQASPEQDALPQSPQQRRLVGSLTLSRAVACRMRGDLAACAQLAHKARRLLSNEANVFYSHAALMEHTARLRAFGIEAESAEEMQASMRECKRRDQLFAWLVLASLTHSVFRLQGKLSQAEAFSLAARDEMLLKWPHAAQLWDASIASLGIGEVHYQRNQLTQAHARISHTLLVARERGDNRVAYSAHVSLAWVHFAQGRREEAVSLLKRLEHPQPHAPGHIQWSYARSLQLSLALGDHQRLLTWQQQAQLRPDDPITFETHVAFLVLVQWLLAQGLTDEAQPFLTALQRACKQQGLTAPLLEATLLQALLYQQKGALSDACQELLSALEMGQQENQLRLFLDAGAPMATLLAKCQRTLPKKSLQPYRRWHSQLLESFSHSESLTTPQDTHIDEAPDTPHTSTDSSPTLPATHDQQHDAAQATKAPQAHDTPQTTETTQGQPPDVTDLYFLDPLSVRELEILTLISEGMTNREISKTLHIALSTAKKHARNIYSKLGVRNRTEAVKRARDLKLLP